VPGLPAVNLVRIATMSVGSSAVDAGFAVDLDDQLIAVQA
jgi:hypothetical protein